MIVEINKLWRKAKKYLAVLGGTLLLASAVLLPAYGQQNVMLAYAAEDGVADFVSRLYMVILDREPDEKGLNDWVSQLADGTKTGVDVTEGFILSKRIYRKGFI